MRGEAEADEEVRRARASLSSIPAVSDVTAELLMQHGFRSAEEVAESDAEGVSEVEGIDADRAAAIVESARQHVAEKRQAEAEALAREAALAEAAAAAANASDGSDPTLIPEESLGAALTSTSSDAPPAGFEEPAGDQDQGADIPEGNR